MLSNKHPNDFKTWLCPCVATVGKASFTLTLQKPVQSLHAVSNHSLSLQLLFLFSTSYQFIHRLYFAGEVAAVRVVSSSCSPIQLVTICILSSNVALLAFQMSPKPNPALPLCACPYPACVVTNLVHFSDSISSLYFGAVFLTTGSLDCDKVSSRLS